MVGVVNGWNRGAGEGGRPSPVRHGTQPRRTAGLFVPNGLPCLQSLGGTNLACRNIASSTCPVAAPTSSKPSAAARSNSAAFCQECRALVRFRQVVEHVLASVVKRTQVRTILNLDRAGERSGPSEPGHKPNLTRRRLPAHFALRENLIAPSTRSTLGAPAVVRCRHEFHDLVTAFLVAFAAVTASEPRTRIRKFKAERSRKHQDSAAGK